MDVQQYLTIFIDETSEHLQALNTHLLILEKEPDNEETINEIFRAAHSIKGMSATMGYNKMQELTHDMENIFSEIRNGKMKATSELVDVLFKGLDCLEAYLASIQQDNTEGDQDNQAVIDEMAKIYDAAMGKTSSPQKKKPSKSVEKSDEDDKMIFKSISLEEHENVAAVKGISMGLNVIGLTVYLQETCMLKAARAFMINRAIESVSDLIKLYPSAQDLEDERYDFQYSAYVITKKTPQEMVDLIMNVSEVKEVVADFIEVSEESETIDTADNNDKSLLGKSTSTEKNAQVPRAAKQVSSRSVRVDIDKLDVLMNYVSELIIAKNSLKSMSESIAAISTVHNYMEQIEYLERLTSNIHESVTQVRMVPIETVVNRFPRMIRDLAKKLDKNIELYMTGEETELDRTVIDEIGDPLMHLLRNSADHGLENKSKRKKTNKPETGSILLNAYQEGNNVIIEVKDDGAGIDLEKIKNKAVEKGTITAEQAAAMSEEEAMGILFKPSFSMADKVTDVSGRGVGLDVVRTKIESLGGALEATTVLGEGSKFVIRLPLTLAIVQSLMIRINEEKYAIPLGSIQTVEDIPFEDIKIIEGRSIIDLRGKVIPIMYLNKILDIPPREEKPETALVVIIKKGDKQAGLVIDDLIGQEEIVIKPIGKHIKSHKIISGATILGNGDIALILDVNSLV
ncbi:MAG TPA: chemotaxis protein CheA [Clostridiales bacterium]|nr:chemotaxis protein CheA [Clostridiales bacterium]